MARHSPRAEWRIRILSRNCMAIDQLLRESMVVSSIFFCVILRAVVVAVFFSHFVHVVNIGTKRGIKKGASRISQTKATRGPAHQNDSERKRRRVANRAMIHLNGPFAASRGFVPSLNSISGTLETSLRRWKKRLQRDPMWRPWQTCAGRHKRIFSKGEETRLATFVRDNSLATGFIFADSNFSDIAMKVLSLKPQDPGAKIRMFQCSAGFIANFKRRHCPTSHRVHIKRRSPVTEDQRQTWLTAIRDVLQNVPWNHIVNCDETS
jgi:hypothetical protein